MKKMLIKNANIVAGGSVFPGALHIEGETISRIFREGEALPELSGGKSADASGADNSGADTSGMEIIDAGGKYLLPGGIDVHTHFDLDVGFTRASDDFYTGTLAAACGGTTTVVDHMAFGPKGVPLTYQPEVYHKLAEPAVIDYGFHGVIQHVDDQVIADMAVLRDMGIPSLKLYLTYDYKIDDPGILRVLRRAKELDEVICVHCENDSILADLRGRFIREGKTAARYHPLSRPAEAEAEAVFRMAMLAKAAGETKIYIVHLSSALGLEALRLARSQGQKNLLAETCPQYLFLDDSRYDDPVEGLKYIMSPPLRKEKDMEVLWDGLTAGDIQTIGTDHCPFFFASQKQRGKDDFTLCPNGAPGVELRMALLFSEGFMKGRLNLSQLSAVASENPARIFGLYPRKGTIAEGSDADLVLFDPDIKWKVTKSLLHENTDYTPYEGMELTGKPVLTISRGEVIAKDGVFTGSKGRGQFLKRT